MFRRSAQLCAALGLWALAPLVQAKSQPAPNSSTFIWGHGYYQARPDAILQFKNFEPKQVKTFTHDRSLRLLRFSEHLEAGIDFKGNLLVWPAKSIDANSEGSSSEQVREGVKVLDKNVVDVRFTQGYIWALNANG